MKESLACKQIASNRTLLVSGYRSTIRFGRMLGFRDCLIDVCNTMVLVQLTY